MKQFYLLAISAISLGLNAQNIVFADSSLKNNLLISSPTNGIAQNFSGANVAIDANDDNEIQISEALLIRSLNLGHPGIDDLGGIGYFTNLQFLNCTGMVALHADLSGLVSLKNLTYANHLHWSLSIFRIYLRLNM